MSDRLAEAGLDRLFRTARTRSSWKTDPVPERLLRELYDLAKLPPTASNVGPGRFVFLTSVEAKARLSAYLSSGSRAKSLAAPVNVIVAYDMAFAEKIPELFPHNPGAAAWFKDLVVAEETAFRNGSLQGAYLILAARALGLDAGPMSGFDKAGVDREFFAGTSWRSNFICNLGYGADENLYARLPRLSFEDACRVI